MSKLEFHVIDQNELEKILPIVLLLNENEPPEVIAKRVENLKMFDTYFCLGVYLNEELIGCCGVWSLYKIYAGKHLEVDNVAISPDHRGLSIGKKMIAWVTNYALENEFKSIELNVYQENDKGINFWSREGFVSKGHHMIKFL